MACPTCPKPEENAPSWQKINELWINNVPEIPKLLNHKLSLSYALALRTLRRNASEERNIERLEAVAIGNAVARSSQAYPDSSDVIHMVVDNNLFTALYIDQVLSQLQLHSQNIILYNGKDYIFNIKGDKVTRITVDDISNKILATLVINDNSIKDLDFSLNMKEGSYAIMRDAPFRSASANGWNSTGTFTNFQFFRRTTNG